MKEAPQFIKNLFWFMLGVFITTMIFSIKVFV
jgi:hypothetical protein